jgi:hypothetical protein
MRLHLSVFIVIIASGSSPMLADAVESVENHRQPDCDAVNCVSLVTRLFHRPYSRPDRQVRSLADAAAELRRSGLDASIYRMRTDDPRRIPVPSIVHREAYDPNGGRLAVFLGVSDSGSAVIFDGATAQTSAESIDEFTRLFTGHGVMVRKPSVSEPIAYSTRSIAAIALVWSAWSWWRRCVDRGAASKGALHPQAIGAPQRM